MYDEAIKIDPKNVDAYNNKGEYKYLFNSSVVIWIEIILIIKS